MTLRHLHIFVTVVQNDNNLTKSAKALYTSQPAVSLAIHEMEGYYGVKLFDRLGKRLYLTEAGRQCLVYARRILSLSDDMEESMKSWNRAGGSPHRSKLHHRCLSDAGDCRSLSKASVGSTPFRQNFCLP